MIWNNWEDLNGWREWFERSRLCAAEQQTKRHTDPHAEGDFPLYSEQEDETHPAYMPWEAFDLVCKTRRLGTVDTTNRHMCR